MLTLQEYFLVGSISHYKTAVMAGDKRSLESLFRDIRDVSENVIQSVSFV